MERFKNYIQEEKFQLVDMDPDTAKVAVQLAKKAGLKPKSQKARSGGLDISVEGPKKKVAKFIMSLPESTANWAKSLELLKRKRLTSSDKKKLDAIRDLLNKEK